MSESKSELLLLSWNLTGSLFVHWGLPIAKKRKYINLQYLTYLYFLISQPLSIFRKWFKPATTRRRPKFVKTLHTELTSSHTRKQCNLILQMIYSDKKNSATTTTTLSPVILCGTDVFMITHSAKKYFKVKVLHSLHSCKLG